MGTHPNGPCTLAESGAPLKTILTPQNMSEGIFSHYHADFPFLFKVLSIQTALSIQAHPDKTLAKTLNASFPSLYKDANHKPEMAIALTEFEAFIGFRTLSEISEHLKKFPEWSGLVTANVLSQFNACVADQNVANRKQALKALFQNVMEVPEAKVHAQLQALVKRLGGQYAKGSLEELFLRLYQQYPNDIGCFGVFLFNYVCLKPGQAIFLAANEPHAYLSGGEIPLHTNPC
jgi:mannose-6-phosphate isomerase